LTLQRLCVQARQADGVWTLMGTWRNEAEGTHGFFAALREADTET